MAEKEREREREEREEKSRGLEREREREREALLFCLVKGELLDPTSGESAFIPLFICVLFACMCVCH